MPLTDIAIRKAKPTEKTHRLFDGGGMYLEISPAGGKWWRLKYRFGDKEKRLSFGTYPDTTLADARLARDEARKLLSTGIDPSQHRKASKVAGAERFANSFEVIAREWFGPQSPTWAKSHASKIMLRLENDLLPGLGKSPVANITAKDVLTTVNHIVARGANESAHRCLKTVARSFATPSPRVAPSATPPPTCAVPCLRSNPATMPPSLIPRPSANYCARYSGIYGGQPTLSFAPLPAQSRHSRQTIYVAQLARLDVEGSEGRTQICPLPS